ncbi:MAG: HEAT repeat domain-containing protein [Acidobacteriota bacterium]|nr:HEAT repeat domain-containing protein [Acidobacteriota bacterium]
MTGSASEATWDECIQLLDQLPSMPLEQRVEAITRLIRNPSPGIRSRALRMGAAALSDDVLTSYLRDDADGVLRNAGLEMLKMRGSRGFTLAVELLRDPDDDVVLQAVLVLDHLKDPRALEPLRAQLRHSDPNVVQAVIVAIGHLGDARTIPDMLPFLEGDSWLQVAAVEALGDIRSPVAVPHLAKLLTDLMMGPLAAEALARIGGFDAFKRLAEHWLRFEQDLDAETMLGLLAHVLEGLPRFPPDVAGLRGSLSLYLHDTGAVRVPAARALLALGPGEQDDEALDLLVDAHLEPLLLPTCLSQRKDLIAKLLHAEDQRRAWGLLLAGRFPQDTPVDILVEALHKPMDAGWLELVVGTLSKVQHRDVAEALLALYRSLPVSSRASLAPVLSSHKEALRELIDGQEGLRESTQIVLAALLGRDPETTAAAIQELDHQDRLAALAQLTDQSKVMGILPWESWLEEAPADYGPLAAEVAVESGQRQLVPALRELLGEHTSPALIRAMGELGDRQSVDKLLVLLEEDSSYRPLVLESLGRIGGPRVREALREVAEGDEEGVARIAYKALSLCATTEDDGFFREAVAHHDWYVRLACAEVLGRFQRPKNLAALVQLASDPVTIVAQRAMALLEPEGDPR